MNTLAVFVLGIVSGYALVALVFVGLLVRGGWELRQYERENGL